MSRFATVEIHTDEFTFSAGHLMLLSENRRESMHGHDYKIHASFKTLIQNNGLGFDCRVYKQKILSICRQLDYHFILPSQSTFFRLEEEGDYWVGYFAQQKILFLKKDAVILPITNVTLEELSFWFLQQLNNNPTELAEHGIHSMTLIVQNGRGESAAAMWEK